MSSAAWALLHQKDGPGSRIVIPGRPFDATMPRLCREVNVSRIEYAPPPLAHLGPVASKVRPAITQRERDPGPSF